MNKFLEKNRLYLIIFVGIILVFIVIKYFTLPKYQAYTSTINEYKKEQVALADLKNKVEQINKNQEKITNITNQLNQLENLTPEGLNEADLFVQLSSVATEAGVVVNSYTLTGDSDTESTSSTKSSKPSKPSASTSLKEFSLPLNIVGSMSGIENYLNRIVRINRLISIESITLAGGTDSNSASASLTVYSL